MTKLLNQGKYVVAVSGGVDSVVLLHMLQQDENLELVVAHFDHGIRSDSSEDSKFVASLAEKYGLPFYTERVELGPKASEETARKYRYDFLRKIQKDTDAQAIVTAHHQDDVIETALLNLLRGTKRKGLISLKSGDKIVRPLLALSKDEIIEYAKKHRLQWREDSTNQSIKYKRNEVRELLKKNLTPEKKEEINNLLNAIKTKDAEISAMVEAYLSQQPDKKLSREDIAQFPDEVAAEIVAEWLRKNKISFDSKTIARILEGVKKLQTGAQIDVQQNHYCLITRDLIVLMRR